MKRQVSVVAIQIGPCTTDKAENLHNALELIDRAAEEKPDFIVFPELFTTPYWPLGVTDSKYFKWAEPIPGPTTEKLGEKAEQLQCYILAPIYEKGRAQGEYYNSAALVGPDGKLVPGILPDGRRVYCYRKNHIGHLYMKNLVIDEVMYMKPGFGFPVFATPKATVGLLICYDRWFPEAWRVLALQGAELIFVPVASPGYFEEAFPRTMRTWAQENMLFAVGCNRAGVETVENRETRYYGTSCIVAPTGDLIKKGPKQKGPSIISAEIDLTQIEKVRLSLQWFRDRRPEIYGPVSRTL